MNSAQGRIEAGEAVKPWQKRMPVEPPSDENGATAELCVMHPSWHGRPANVMHTLPVLGLCSCHGFCRSLASMLYWFLKLFVLGPVLRTLFRPKIIGRKNFPRKGAAILASNHVSFSDSIFLPLVAPRRITFLAKSEYFTGRGIKGKLSKAFFAGVGQVPIDRSGGRASEAAIQTGLSILRNGELLGIYPEGTRSPDGRLYRGRTGVARMALEAGVPIVPVAMIGTYEIQPTGQVWPRIKRVKIAYGEPIDVSEYLDQAKDPVVLRAITNRVMEALQQMSGQEYVDIYATKARALQDAQARAEEAEEINALAEEAADADEDSN